jgi:hypothetical protein
MTELVARTYGTSDDAHEIAEILEGFRLRPVVTQIVIESEDGNLIGWEVRLALPVDQPRPPPVPRPDPLDLDETVDYIDSHWDREADDREINSRRGRHVD